MTPTQREHLDKLLIITQTAAIKLHVLIAKFPKTSAISYEVNEARRDHASANREIITFVERITQ